MALQHSNSLKGADARRGADSASLGTRGLWGSVRSVRTNIFGTQPPVSDCSLNSHPACTFKLQLRAFTGDCADTRDDR